MKTYIDVSIYSQYSQPNEFINALIKFANRSGSWEYLEKQSIAYATGAGAESCAILMKGNKHHPAIAITNKNKNIFYIANIVPKESGSISLTEYNRISKEFAKSLIEYKKNEKAKFTVKITSDKVTLSTIITGKKSRELFERYLNLFPTSYHANDIERLDVFICALARFSKKNIDLDLLKVWLINEKQWTKKDADWCTNRVNIGLDILKANKKF